MAKHIVNPNLRFLHSSLKSGKKGVLLEGSSRSGKTFSSLQFIIYLCARKETSATINIIKETYNSFKTTLYDDFNRILLDFGLVSPFAEKQEVKSFRLFGNKINFLGADAPSKFHGAGCDYFYCNEMFDIPQEVFDQSEMRCRKFWWGDYNPKYTDHWVFDKISNRPDVGLLKTTFKDNLHFISENELSKIRSYEPNEENIKNGTADEYMWNVYGLGLRSAPEGLVFQHVTWVKEFPKNIERVWYGLDFGYTNSPSALSKVGIFGNEIYAQCLFYYPTPSINELLPAIQKYCTESDTIWADPSGESGGRGMISQLRRSGFKVMATNTFPGSIKYGISLMKKFKLNFIDEPNARKEQGGYRYRVIQGIRLDEPIDDFNHWIDATRMAIMSNVR